MILFSLGKRKKNKKKRCGNKAGVWRCVPDTVSFFFRLP